MVVLNHNALYKQVSLKPTLIHLRGVDKIIKNTSFFFSFVFLFKSKRNQIFNGGTNVANTVESNVPGYEKESKVFSPEAICALHRKSNRK